MKISALRLYNVKRFAGRGVAIEGIGDGVNVLCAANEYGKSTSFEALHALFFQPHTGLSKDVRRMQPYAGGHPLIQADIETAEGRYRITKQFIGGKRATVSRLNDGRLIAQADEAERFIADLVRGGTLGPAGLLWVRQGITGLEERDRKDEENERRAREDLLTSVQGEVEAITGGRRMAEVIAACEDERLRLVTATGQPRRGGPYQLALQTRADLAARETALAGEVTRLRQQLDARSLAMKRLAELEDADEVAQRRAAVVKAEAAFATAKAHDEALKTAAAEAALARSRRDQAKADRDAYREALARAASLQTDVAAAQAQRAEMQARQKAARAAADAALQDVQAAELREQAARELCDRLATAARAREAAAAREALRARVADADALRNQLEDTKAALALVAISEESLDQLQALEVEIARLRAAQEAHLPTLRIDYQPGVATPARLDGTPIAGGEERSFAGTAKVELPGLGTLTLQSNRPAAADRALAQAEARRQQVLSRLGIASLAEGHRRRSEAQALSARLEGLRQQLAHLAPEGVQRLREELARHDSIDLEAGDATGDPEAARRTLTEASRALTDARNAARELQPLCSRADEAVVKAETAHATLTLELARLDEGLGPAQQRAAREQTLAATLTDLQARFEMLEAKAAALRSAAPDLDSAEAALRRVQSAEQAANQEIARLRETLAELNAEIRTRSEDAVEETWQETNDALAAANARVAAFETEVALLTKLRDTLQTSRSTARDLYLHPVITELRPLLGLLFDDVAVVFDETTLLPQTLRRHGQDEDVQRLSGGMREQLSVLTRLAFARLLARNGRPAPVILDDALVYSDDDRIERMFDALHRQARDQQIIVFSCRQRAFARLGGNVLQMTEWRPEPA